MFSLSSLFSKLFAGFFPALSLSRARFLRGFTLVEMMVVVSIIVIMTGVVLAGLPGFRDRSSLDLVAQEVALVIRQAQAFGSQTRFAAAAFPSYGIYFNISDVNQTFQSSNSFRLFADIGSPSDGHFSDGAGTQCAASGAECREVYTLGGGITITELNLCVKDSGTETCNSLGLDHLNIIFNRPNPEAHFADNYSSSNNPNNLDNNCNGNACSYAKVILSSAKTGTAKNICVWSTGHIYVTGNSSC